MCPSKSASKANLSNMSSFNHLTCADTFSEMVGPNLVNLFSLENRLLKISYDPSITKFGPEMREL